VLQSAQLSALHSSQVLIFMGLRLKTPQLSSYQLPAVTRLFQLLAATRLFLWPVAIPLFQLPAATRLFRLLVVTPLFQLLGAAPLSQWLICFPENQLGYFLPTARIEKLDALWLPGPPVDVQLSRNRFFLTDCVAKPGARYEGSGVSAVE
jgi:hypothetical protein